MLSLVCLVLILKKLKMTYNLKFELSFKNIAQLENKLNFCRLNGIHNINIPCKGSIKKEFLNSVIEYIKCNYKEFKVTFHYSLYHQYIKNVENSYQAFLSFIKMCNSNDNYEILLISGSNKKKNFEVINVLSSLKKEKNLKVKFGTAYNPYLKKYYKIPSERDRYQEKISSGLIKSIWFQFGTDINLLEREFYYIKNNNKSKNIKLFGSILIPSKQFIARFKFRPWKEVYISDKYLNSLEQFYVFTKELLCFYIENNITPLIETDFYSLEKLDYIYSLLQ